jgi:hypothetical protein
MYNLFIVVFSLALAAVCIAVLVAKRPHKSWLKIALTGCVTVAFLNSIYGAFHVDKNVAIGCTLAMAVILILAWRTHRGWSEWWQKL